MCQIRNICGQKTYDDSISRNRVPISLNSATPKGIKRAACLYASKGLDLLETYQARMRHNRCVEGTYGTTFDLDLLNAFICFNVSRHFSLFEDSEVDMVG